MYKLVQTPREGAFTERTRCCGSVRYRSRSKTCLQARAAAPSATNGNPRPFPAPPSSNAWAELAGSRGFPPLPRLPKGGRWLQRLLNANVSPSREHVQNNSWCFPPRRRKGHGGGLWGHLLSPAQQQFPGPNRFLD